MSFSAEQFLSRLASLEDSQESIGGASKWLLSQYREASQIAECWRNYMKKKSVNTRRKLLGIYLANHVVQQAKGRKIGQFQEEFGKVAADVIRDVYPELPRDLKKKVKRVADIWKEREIFSVQVLKEIQAIFESEGSTVNEETVPLELRKLVSSWGELSKVEQYKQTMRSRFDKAVESLDPSSVVYEENLKTVTRIGQSSKDASSQAIKMREARISALQELLREEEKVLDDERNAMSEIDIILQSKNPRDVNQISEDQDLLPTYETGNDGDDDEESSDNDSSDESKDAISATKRQNEETSMDGVNVKRSKIASEDAVGVSEEGYEPQNQSAGQTTEEYEGSPVVTSSIQDLLSKLAS
ncbi:hypothetical protein HG537_0E03410 [Torulaspora globosa]|uniref:CID domain-containing protein n=1 Tax=Torulaspora globosa TaxID=48254 RepID=A0A7H9HVP3_9SACH|nr:hypothetical protein HG537_0E03410 [Torulaspora sp. CBS 2947]